MLTQGFTWVKSIVYNKEPRRSKRICLMFQTYVLLVCMSKLINMNTYCFNIYICVCVCVCVYTLVSIIVFYCDT